MKIAAKMKVGAHLEPVIPYWHWPKMTPAVGATRVNLTLAQWWGATLIPAATSPNYYAGRGPDTH